MTSLFTKATQWLPSEASAVLVACIMYCIVDSLGTWKKFPRLLLLVAFLTPLNLDLILSSFNIYSRSLLWTPESYQPLLQPSRSIRLLHVQGGNHSETLVGSLEIYPLSFWPRYEALSYTWGSGELSNYIIIDDKRGVLEAMLGNTRDTNGQQTPRHISTPV